MKALHDKWNKASKTTLAKKQTSKASK
jgi:hypothetical protein